MLTRRQSIQSTLGLLAAARVGSSGPARKPPAGKAGIRLALALPADQSSRHRLAKQMGVNYVITGAPFGNVRKEQYYDAIVKAQGKFAENGLKIAGVESHPVAAEKIKLGLPGRDEEIENYKWAIEALSKAGVPLICYNFMAGIGWYRTNVNLPERGGALSSEFDNSAAMKQGLTQWGEISEEKMWSNIDYFLKAVMPVAEKFKMPMALHPDDPPLAKLRGIARICVSAKNYERIMSIVPSKYNGVTYCQANFLAMGEDIGALAAKWCQQKKIFFVHFRDIAGNAGKFRETFHDNGPTDMARMLKIYHENGFSGPMRPDHAPTMETESNDNPGYAILGRMLAIGYMRGMMDGQGIPHE